MRASSPACAGAGSGTTALSAGLRPHVARSPPDTRRNFFKRLTGGGVLSVMARTRGELAIAQAPQDPAQRLLADRDAEFRIDPLRQIDQPPAHHPVHRRVRAG